MLEQNLSRLLLAFWLATWMLIAGIAPAGAQSEGAGEAGVAEALSPVPEASADLEIVAATVSYLPELDLLVFEQQVRGTAGGVVPKARGELHGAPVLGYVFPTDLDPKDVGFEAEEGIVSLAVTSHPDFDDTPLWDEDNNRRYDDDGAVFHTHWVVLGKDPRVPGGLAVRQIRKEEMATVLPPTHPGMPMLMDSPGFSVLLQGDTLKVLVPAQRISHRRGFHYDAVASYMEVRTSGDVPMLGVYRVYSVLSGDLSLPFEVQRR